MFVCHAKALSPIMDIFGFPKFSDRCQHRSTIFVLIVTCLQIHVSSDMAKSDLGFLNVSEAF